MSSVLPALRRLARRQGASAKEARDWTALEEKRPPRAPELAPGDVTADPETWPANVLAFRREVVRRLERGGLTAADALLVATTRIGMGWIDLPPISVRQREDGSWPSVGLRAPVEWTPRVPPKTLEEAALGRNEPEKPEERDNGNH